MKDKKKKKKVKLTQEEKEIITACEDALDRGEMEFDAPPHIKQQYTDAVRHHVDSRKEFRVNMRINAKLIEQLKEQAEKEGLPYQTYINSILHKFATGQLIEKKAYDQTIRELKDFFS